MAAEALIKAISKADVHRICAEQVVVNLATAVKELVENSLDAGARCVDIRVTDYGSGGVEVSDDGAGIEPANFEALALKHHTSKIEDFDDVATVKTFGFRGEALSSLCAVAKLTVSTRHQSCPTGCLLEFDPDGVLASQITTPRPVGTCVSLKELFHSTPVRLRQFRRNYKREFAKVVQTVQAYAIISSGVRISLVHSHGSKQGRATTLIRTGAQDDLRQRVADVFDLQQAKGLLELDGRSLAEKWADEEGPFPGSAAGFDLNGLVSPCVHGKGRSSPDRQFYFVNGRPFDSKALSRLANEVYHQFNRHQYPFVVLSLRAKEVPDECHGSQGPVVDVNITPDKRVVFFEREKLLLDLVRQVLTDLYQDSPATFLTSSGIIPTLLPRPTENEAVEPEEPSQGTNAADKPTATLANLGALFGTQQGSENCGSSHAAKGPKRLTTVTKSSTSSRSLGIEKFVERTSPPVAAVVITLEGCLSGARRKRPLPARSEDDEEVIVKVEADSKHQKKVRTLSVAVDLNVLRRSLNGGKGGRDDDSSPLDGAGVGRKFLCKIDPAENESAEKELRRVIRHEDFCRMAIIGQFNKGFAITKLDRDLFIIDQHASDEIYNFERLQKTEKLRPQRLAVPQALQLSSVERSLLVDNLATFTANGFELEFPEDGDGEEAAAAAVYLKGVPVSRNWTFGKADIEEMLFVMSGDGSPASGFGLLRPSRVRSMFASRACRSSVMVGTALSRSDLRKYVNQMAATDLPWNCPHGRPTMRHLINLDMLPEGKGLDAKHCLENSRARRR